jgi:transglutaminase/protease-like cytokinesis protein 3
MILKKIVDTRYSVIKSKYITADIKDQNLVYINSIQNIYWLPQMQPVLFARGSLIDELLNEGAVTKDKLDLESFKLLWSYIISNIYYDKEKYSNISNLIGYVPDINATFNEKKGICYDYASFMSALMRSYGVPVKLVAGYCPSYYDDSYHAWNEVLIDGEWITVDVTYDAAYYQSGKKVQFEKNKSLYTATKIY